jgi:hypothetical protein
MLQKTMDVMKIFPPERSIYLVRKTQFSLDFLTKAQQEFWALGCRFGDKRPSFYSQYPFIVGALQVSVRAAKECRR